MTLRVENENWSQVTVYAIRDHAEAIRLGEVTGLTTAQLRLPTTALSTDGQVYVAVRPLAHDAVWLSEGVAVHAGSLVRLTVAPLLSTSSLYSY